MLLWAEAERPPANEEISIIMTADTARIAVEDVALVRTNNSLLPNIISRKILFKVVVHSQISERLHLDSIFKTIGCGRVGLIKKRICSLDEN